MMVMKQRNEGEVDIEDCRRNMSRLQVRQCRACRSQGRARRAGAARCNAALRKAHSVAGRQPQGNGVGRGSAAPGITVGA